MHILDFILSSCELWQITGCHSLDSITFQTSKQQGKLPGTPIIQTSIIRLSAKVRGRGCSIFSEYSFTSRKKKKTSLPNSRGLPKIGFFLPNKHIPHSVVYFLCPTGASIPTEMRNKWNHSGFCFAVQRGKEKYVKNLLIERWKFHQQLTEESHHAFNWLFFLRGDFIAHPLEEEEDGSWTVSRGS